MLGLNSANARGWGKIQSVQVTVDMGTGKPVPFEVVDEKISRAAKKFFGPLIQHMGVSVIGT